MKVDSLTGFIDRTLDNEKYDLLFYTEIKPTETSQVFGYVRVSKEAQDYTLQLHALSEIKISETQKGIPKSNIVEEKHSGARYLEELDKLLCRMRKGDILYVWKLDRLGRGFVSLVYTFAELCYKGIIVKSIVDNIDTTTPMGRLMFIGSAALSQWEREQISIRTKSKLAEVIRKGEKKVGRPQKIDEELAKVVMGLWVIITMEIQWLKL